MMFNSIYLFFFMKKLFSEEEEKSCETEEITISVPTLSNTSNKTFTTLTLEDDPSVIEDDQSIIDDDIQNRKVLKFDPVVFAPIGDVYSFFHVGYFFKLNVQKTY